MLFDSTEVDEKDWHPVYAHLVHDRVQVSDTTEYLDSLYDRFRSLLDTNFIDQFARATPQRVWELQCAELLAESGHVLSASPGGFGPDYWANLDGYRVAFECITPTNGSGPNSVTVLEPGRIGYGQDVEITRRIVGGLIEKHRKIAGWQAHSSQILRTDDAFVICMTAANLDLGDMEYDPQIDLPRIVKAVFGIGKLEYVFEMETGRSLGTRYKMQPSIPSASGKTIATNLFLDPAYAEVSALVYARHHVKNRPATRGMPIGSDTYVIHNPLARVPFPHGKVKCAFEFYVESDGRLVWRS